jgi:hypothetical protein
MAYTQTPGFTKEMGAGIAKVISNLQQRNITSGEETGTSAKTQGDNTTARRSLNFKKVEKDKGGTESVVNQTTGEEIVTTAPQRATNKAAATNQLAPSITGNTTFDNTSGTYSAASYKGKSTPHGFKLHDGTFLRSSQNKFNNSPLYAKHKATYEKDLKNYTQKANAQASNYNKRASTHNNSQ